MIVWTEQAVRQLHQAYDYILLANSEAVAARVSTQILATVARLANFPQLGRMGRIPGTRELVIARTPFLAAYTVEPARIVILALYHAARQWPESF